MKDEEATVRVYWSDVYTAAMFLYDAMSALKIGQTERARGLISSALCLLNDMMKG